MHNRRDIIRSQMFYSVYTNVTCCNYGARTNFAQSVLVSKVPVKDERSARRMMSSENYLCFFPVRMFDPTVS